MGRSRQGNIKRLEERTIKRASGRWGLFLALLCWLMLFVVTGTSRVLANAAVSPRVIGGEDAQSPYPWMVSLYRTVTSAHHCGATLISNRYLLTAAHCVEPATLADAPLSAWIGPLSYDDINIGEQVKVEAVVIHPLYDADTLDNDIAVLRLAKSVAAEPIALSTTGAGDEFMSDENGLLLGFGAVQMVPEERYPTTLQQVEIPIIERSSCVSDYMDQNYTITDTMFCAGQNGDEENNTPDIDACGGDSGGPLVVDLGNDQYRQVGVVSFGDAECDPGSLPGVYADVSFFARFIELAQRGAVYGADIGHLAVGRTATTTVHIDNWSDAPFSIDAVLENSDVVTSIDFSGCTKVALESSCPLTLTISSDEPQYLNETIRLSVQSDSTSMDQIEVTIVGWVLGEFDASSVVNDSSIAWYTGGDASWEVTSEDLYSGTVSLGSGRIRYPEESLMMAYIDGPANFGFVDKVVGGSLETLEVFSTVGVQRAGSLQSYGGEGWSFNQFELANGEYQILWRYQRSGVDSAPERRAYIDEVTVSNSVIVDPTKETDGGGGDIRALLLILLFSWFRYTCANRQK